MNFISDIRNILLASLVGLFVGLCAGYWAKGKFVAAQQTEALVEVRKEDAQSVQDVIADDKRVRGVLYGIRLRTDNLRSEARTHVETTFDQGKGAATCPDPVLGSDLVRVLNAARSGAADNPASERDGASSAAAAAR